jgi:uncharacterized C2H2 Zn-finger protein
MSKQISRTLAAVEKLKCPGCGHEEFTEEACQTISLTPVTISKKGIVDYRDMTAGESSKDGLVFFVCNKCNSTFTLASFESPHDSYLLRVE